MTTKQTDKRKRKDDGAHSRAADRVREGAHPYVHYLGLRSYRTAALLKRISEGLSYAAFERLQRHLGMSANDLGKAILISSRTLSRRKEAGRLEPDESDRLVRLTRIFSLALDLFEGDREAARQWLGRKQIGLGGVRPIDLVSSEVGAREVEALIGRLEHGVFS